jgi:hypothetical protein
MEMSKVNCSRSDSEGSMWRDFIAAWWETHGEKPVRAAELVELCNKGELISPVIGDGTERSQSTRLGKALQNARERVFGFHRIEAAGKDHDSKRPLHQLVQVQPLDGDR